MTSFRLILAAALLVVTVAACGTSTITGPEASQPSQTDVWVGTGSRDGSGG